MSRPDGEPSIVGSRLDKASAVLTTPLPEGVAALCRRIIDRIPERPLPRNIEVQPEREARWKLRALCERPASPDGEELNGYRWPASQLTDEDRRRLNVISNMTKVPCTKLLHLAVAALFDQTRSVMAELLRVHETTGQPLARFLGQDFDIRQHLPAAAPKQWGQRDASPRQTGETLGDTARNHVPCVDTPAIVAEPTGMSIAETSPGSSDSNPTPVESRISGPTQSEQPEHTSDLIAEIQGLRNELRVAWQAIDELREWADHALRNPLEPPSPPLRIWSLASDPTANDFGQRINAVPPEQMEALRQSLTTPASVEPAPRPAAQQRDLF